MFVLPFWSRSNIDFFIVENRYQNSVGISEILAILCLEALWASRMVRIRLKIEAQRPYLVIVWLELYYHNYPMLLIMSGTLKTNLTLFSGQGCGTPPASPPSRVWGDAEHAQRHRRQLLRIERIWRHVNWPTGWNVEHQFSLQFLKEKDFKVDERRS